MGAIAAKVEQNKQIAKTGEYTGLKAYINRMSGEITRALPKVGITPERFTRLCISSVSSNEDLQKCTPNSFLAAMMTCAQMGIEPNTPLGQAYLIPYKNHKKGTVECQFQLGYKGMIELAYRSGQISSIMAEVVYSNDEFIYELGIDTKLVHKPCMSGPRGDIKCVYAVWKGKDGGYGFGVMSVDDINRHRQRYSKTINSPWDSSWEEMAKKTVLKRALKYAPLSIEIHKAIDSDEAVKHEIAEDMSDIQSDMIFGEGSVGEADDSDFIGQEEPESIDPETGEMTE